MFTFFDRLSFLAYQLLMWRQSAVTSRAHQVATENLSIITITCGQHTNISIAPYQHPRITLIHQTRSESLPFTPLNSISIHSTAHHPLYLHPLFHRYADEVYMDRVILKWKLRRHYFSCYFSWSIDDSIIVTDGLAGWGSAFLNQKKTWERLSVFLLFADLEQHFTHFTVPTYTNYGANSSWFIYKYQKKICHLLASILLNK